MQRAVGKKPPSMKAISQRLKQEQDIRAQRNKLALTSIRDTLSILSPMGGSNDEEEFDLTNFDVKVYYANPKAFEKLPFYKRTVVVEDNKEKLKKNWRTLNKDVKRFAFWWAYGAHGPRDGFPEHYDWFTPYEPKVKGEKTDAKISDIIKETDNVKTQNEAPKVERQETQFDELINTITPTSSTTHLASKAALQSDQSNLNASQLNVQSQVPLDLPFKYPSVLGAPPFGTTVGIKAKKLPPLDPRSFGVKRIQQYREDRRMNPVAKIALVICIFLTVLCFKQDRRVNVTGVIPEYPWDVIEKEERERLKKIQEEEELERQLKQSQLDLETRRTTKKWYYLWLK